MMKESYKDVLMKSSKTVDNLNYEYIVIQGPKHKKFYVEKFAKKGLHVIGDGERYLNKLDIVVLESMTSKNAVITINAHGSINNHCHYVSVYQNHTRTIDLINNLYKIRGVSIICLNSCYGGKIHSELNDSMPQGAAIVSFSHANRGSLIESANLNILKINPNESTSRFNYLLRTICYSYCIKTTITIKNEENDLVTFVSKMKDIDNNKYYNNVKDIRNAIKSSMYKFYEWCKDRKLLDILDASSEKYDKIDSNIKNMTNSISVNDLRTRLSCNLISLFNNDKTKHIDKWLNDKKSYKDIKNKYLKIPFYCEYYNTINTILKYNGKLKLNHQYKNDNGTFLHAVIRFGNLCVIDTLLKSGFSPLQKNNNNLTCLDIAAQYGQIDAIMYILNYLKKNRNIRLPYKEKLILFHQTPNHNKIKALKILGCYLEKEYQDFCFIEHNVIYQEKYRKEVNVNEANGQERDISFFSASRKNSINYYTMKEFKQFIEKKFSINKFIINIDDLATLLSENSFFAKENTVIGHHTERYLSHKSHHEPLALPISMTR